MKNSVCPKCFSTEIYHAENGFYPSSNHKYGMRILEGEGWNADITVVTMTHYVCRACGYFESYVNPGDPDFAKIETSSNWKK